MISAEMRYNELSNGCGPKGDEVQSNMVELLADVNKVIHDFLGIWLPKIGGEDWWKRYVLYALTDSQLRHVEQKGIEALSGLDLAALSRVLVRNWSSISWKAGLSRDGQHYLKEIQIIRNRWAHAGVDAYPPADVYRDLDTIVRFLSELDADEAIAAKARQARDDVLQVEQPMVKTTTGPENDKSPSDDDGSKFSMGEIVCLVSNPEKYGAVIAIQSGGVEYRYQVFIGGASSSFYESQLQVVASEGGGASVVSLDRFNAQMSALQIQHPSLSTLYSLNSARIDFIPYQFRPVMKFIRADRPRLLIADGVGVGKTIEAGLILREFQARREVKSVLIICPRPLVTEKKWVSEMRRFDERFTQLDGASLRYCITECDMEGEWPDQHAKTILPYSLFDEVLLHGTDSSGSKRRKKKQKGLLDLDPPPKFDLVIVDEAHHVRNPSTFTHEAVKFFCDSAEAVLFLTATPVQMGSQDLFVLLNMLRPDLVIDQESFGHMAQPNPYINRAIDVVRAGEDTWEIETLDALNEASSTAWGGKILAKDPDFRQLSERLAVGGMSAEDRIGAIPTIEGFHTFSNIINRTRRRDIGEFTVREPKTVSVEFTPAQRALHDELLETQAEILSNIHAGHSINFMMTTIRRQAASCIFGLAPLLGDILNRRTGEMFEQEGDDAYNDYEIKAIEAVQDRIAAVLSLAGQLGNDDPKLEALRKIIRDKQSLANNKLMIFSTFRHTLGYLFGKLSGAGVRVGLVHGGTPDEERISFRRRFKLPAGDDDAVDVLLFSEVGCEGLDYQFCDCMVNYDLPWNPMKIEQRIGRIDRNGQKSEKVLIYNLITPGTVDADIYERCLMRIGIFNNAVGASEEILGNIAKQINSVAEDIKLSHEERQEKLQQLADNEIRDIQEQQKLEDKQAELFGIRLPADQLQKEIDNASSYWLSVPALENLVVNYLTECFGGDQEHVLGEKASKKLRVSQDRRAALLKDYQKLPRQASTANKKWEDWLKGGDPHLAVTFEGKTAVEDPSLAFINPLHPLVKQAAQSLGAKGSLPLVTLSAVDNEINSGDYQFAIYEWSYMGVAQDLKLRPITEDDRLSLRLPDFLEHARSLDLPESELPGDSGYQELDKKHHEMWLKAKADHQENNRRLVSYRRESLEGSHRARIAILDEKLANATNDKIIRMRQAERANAEADYRRRVIELDQASNRADITAQPVAYGVIRITGGLGNE